MAARYTVIQAVIYIHSYTEIKKHKKRRNNKTQITSAQTWQTNFKSVLWLSCLTVSPIAHCTNDPLHINKSLMHTTR